MRAIEEMLFDHNVGAKAQGFSSKNNEGGVERLIRTVCKAIQDRGCEKSGKPVHFRAFLRDKGRNFVPLAPFKGNRFNILFHNGAGVYFLQNDLRDRPIQQ